MSELKELTLELPPLSPETLPGSIPSNRVDDLFRRITSLLPKKKEIALFKKRVNPDPILAINIFGFWFSIYKWE